MYLFLTKKIAVEIRAVMWIFLLCFTAFLWLSSSLKRLAWSHTMEKKFASFLPLYAWDMWVLPFPLVFTHLSLWFRLSYSVWIFSLYCYRPSRDISTPHKPALHGSHGSNEQQLKDCLKHHNYCMLFSSSFTYFILLKTSLNGLSQEHIRYLQIANNTARKQNQNNFFENSHKHFLLYACSNIVFTTRYSMKMEIHRPFKCSGFKTTWYCTVLWNFTLLRL